MLAPFSCGKQSCTTSLVRSYAPLSRLKWAADFDQSKTQWLKLRVPSAMGLSSSRWRTTAIQNYRQLMALYCPWHWWKPIMWLVKEIITHRWCDKVELFLIAQHQIEKESPDFTDNEPCRGALHYSRSSSWRVSQWIITFKTQKQFRAFLIEFYS